MPMPWKLRLFWYRLDKAALAAALFFALVRIQRVVPFKERFITRAAAAPLP